MPSPQPCRRVPDAALTLRSILGGTLMGLANLVPGISGGTMLLATGIYPRFVAAVAEVTTLRFRLEALALLGAVGAAAAGVIVLLAGPVRGLVVSQRWAMYSLFIGLTLGGVPLLLRMARPLTRTFAAGTGAGLVAMILLAFSSPPTGAQGGGSLVGLFAAGVAGAAAMVLPGVSGGYLLLVLGQYLVILAAIDALKRGLLVPLAVGGALDAALLGEFGRVALPVGLGVLVGVAAVSNLVRLALDRFPQATLGVLLGLLLGAGVGLWPFQRVEPEADAALAPAVDPDAAPLVRYAPHPLEAGASLGLVFLGFGATLAIGRLGDGESG